MKIYKTIIVFSFILVIIVVSFVYLYSPVSAIVGQLNIQNPQTSNKSSFSITGNDTNTGVNTSGTTISGSNVTFGNQLKVGDSVTVGSDTRIITAVNANNTLTVNSAFSSPLNNKTMSVNPGILSFTDANGVGKLIMDSSGNLGIGITVPAAKLDIAGSTSTLSNTSGNINITPNANTIFTSGNVGIGTTSPGSLLTVGSTGQFSVGSTGIVTAGTWNGSAIADSYISSASTWNAKAPTASPTFTGNVTMPGTGIWNSSGNVGVGTTAPGAKLEVNGALKVGGSETGTADSDIKAYIQKVLCQNRRGVWVDGTGCTEYAYVTSTSAAWPGPACAAGYHICTFPDLWYGGFTSLARPGYNVTSATGYVWVGGSYISNQNTFMYPWGYDTTGSHTCSAGAHFMLDIVRNNGGYTAWGCYPDSYTNATLCCSNTN